MFSIKLPTYAADNSFAGALGMALVTAEAFAAGIASVPEPFSDADWGGWLVWRSFAHHYDVSTDVGRMLGSWSMEIDSKAMRKASPNEVLIVVVESQSGGGAFDVAAPIRTLVKHS